MKEPTSCCPPPASDDRPLPMAGEDFERELSAYAKALGHPARVRIIRLLAARRDCVCGDIVGEVGLAQSTAGLIQGAVDGPRVCYCQAPAAVRRCKALFGLL
jgi:DNA-binding transcriptional ArsR family regulator